MDRINYLLIFLVFACQIENKTENDKVDSYDQSNETEPKRITKKIPSLHGTWFTNGNEGIVPSWIEFDSSDFSYYSWLDDEIIAGEPSGTYKIVEGRIIELDSKEFNYVERHTIDSITSNYMKISSTGVNAGPLEYQRKEYKPKINYSNFLHIYINYALDRTVEYWEFKYGENSLKAKKCTFIEGNTDCHDDIEIELLKTSTDNYVFAPIDFKGDTIPTWTFRGDSLIVYNFDNYLNSWYQMSYFREE